MNDVMYDAPLFLCFNVNDVIAQVRAVYPFAEATKHLGPDILVSLPGGEPVAVITTIGCCYYLAALKMVSQ